MKRTGAALLLSLLLAPAALGRQSIEWTKVKGPYGASVSSVDVSPAGDIWITVNGDLARSSDLGKTWNEVRPAETWFSKMAFVGNEAIITGRHRSLDRGQTWERTGLPDSVFVREMVYEPVSSTVLVLSSEAVWRSQDLGSTYVHANEELSSITALADGTLLGVRPNSVYLARSVDAGKTWGNVRLAAAPGAPTFWRGYRPTGRPWEDSTGVYVTGTGGPWSTPFFRSTDSGSTWTIHRNGCPIREFYGADHQGRLLARSHQLVQVSPTGSCQRPFGDREIRDAALLPGGQAIAVVSGNLVIPDAHGGEWVEIPLTGLSMTSVNAIAADPRAGRWWVGTEESGAFKSDDGGISWTSAGPQGAVVSGIAPGPSPDEVWVATFWTGLYRTRDAGDNWDVVPSPTACGEGDAEPFLNGITYHPGNGSLNVSWPYCNLFHTDDGGETWGEFSAPTRSTVDPPIWASHFADDGSVLASMFYPLAPDWEVLRLVAGTTDWVRVGEKLPQPAYLVFQDSRGRIWAGLSAPGASPSIVPRLDRTQGGLYSAEASDASWSLRALYGRIPTDMLETPDGGLWLAHSEGIMRSQDGGDTWVAANTGLAEPCVNSLEWDPFWREVLAGTCGDGLYSLALPSTIDVVDTPSPDGRTVSAFPNPFASRLGFEMTGEGAPTSLELFDVLGRRVLSKKLDRWSQKQFVDTSNLPDGLYLYRLNFGSGSVSGTVVRLGQ